MNRLNVRQGDILFTPVTPEEFTEETQRYGCNKLNHAVIAEGEATGHHHQVAEADLAHAELYRNWNGQSFLRVTDQGVSIVHEEHGPQVLEPGFYQVRQAREYDYLARLSRAVRD